MHTVIETQTFLRKAQEAGMTDAERFDLVTFLGTDPVAGDLIQGSGYRVITLLSLNVAAGFHPDHLRQEREGYS